MWNINPAICDGWIKCIVQHNEQIIRDLLNIKIFWYNTSLKRTKC